MLKKAAALGVAGLMLGVSPAAAGSISDGTTVVLTMVGGGGLMSLGCMAIALVTQNDEEEEEGYDRRGFYAGIAPSYARENFSDSAVVNLVDGELQEGLTFLRRIEVKPPTVPKTYINPPPSTFNLDDIDEDTFGFNGRVGYRCHPNISAELQFEWLDDFDGNISENGMPLNDTARKYDLELESLVFTTNVKAHLLTGRYQPFVLLGVGFMRMESKSHDTTPAPRMRPPGCPNDVSKPCFAAQASDRRVEVAARFGGGLDFYITENWVATGEVSYLMPTGKLDDLDYYTIGIGLQYRF
jgi:opacity protein-like surface antigen